MLVDLLRYNVQIGGTLEQQFQLANDIPSMPF